MTAKNNTKKRSTRKQTTPSFQGWRTSDQDEIERRRQRGAVEPGRIETVAGGDPFYGDYRVRSGNGGCYEVEIRSLAKPINSCGCPDHAVNRLGTCKHVEAVLCKVAKGKKRRFQAAAGEGSPWVEIFLDRRDEKIRVLWPQHSRPRSKLHQLLDPFFSTDGSLLNDVAIAFPVLRRKIAETPKVLRDKLRISQQLEPWLMRLMQQAGRDKARQVFDKDIASGKRTLDMVNMPLYPYQQQGMRHLAFTERALLADEMGLGKTVQAIAACELLRRLRGAQRVLVISPASLKAEWEEQIEKFSGLGSLIIQGPRATRLKQYRQESFFYLCNYEQIMPDAEEIQLLLAPDIIILDEAQRIKNWQTKTANAVKRLKSRYAFVLTGTPLENRIDEIYSIVQFLDPHLFGPLFRFNRDFYELDEKGQPCGYKNLDKLHRRLRPVMLRRRKDEVEGDLPGRTVNNYFVSMTEEQALRYDEYNGHVARLMAMAQRRPLRKEEWEKLQKWLACMRMLCDTPYILDPECKDSPKLEELEKIFGDLLDEGDHKILIFSEWTRMLDLVCGLADRMDIGYALHTGKIQQSKRRHEIRRFKDDPHCRLFLSSDSGSTGLNLQNADVVINLDLPWNPAKLEQRIARAWRKHQKRAVQVINLVCEHSIEHRMLHLLDQKQNLAQEVVDGAGQLTSMKMPSGRAAFMERMETLMGQPTTPPPLPIEKPAATKHEDDPLQRLREESVFQWGERLDLLQVHNQGSTLQAKQTVVAVVDHLDEPLCNTLQQSVADNLPGHSLEVLDRATYETIQRLIENGVLSLNQEAQTLHQSTVMDKPQQQIQRQRLRRARQQLQQAERKHSMAQVLAAGGFVIEALPVLSNAVEEGLASLALLDAHEASPLSITFIESHLVNNAKAPPNTTALVTQLRKGSKGLNEKEAVALLESGAALMQHIAETLNKAALQ
ncbi:MAG TPA: DEAD/DEAH box helicase [Acidiferrobacteraceae bacterium]|nr:DEAD/DEAH box helicase [Acidiferrobacteraceae bacterium]